MRADRRVGAGSNIILEEIQNNEVTTDFTITYNSSPTRAFARIDWTADARL